MKIKLLEMYGRLIREITTRELKDKYYPNVPDKIYGAIVSIDPTYNADGDKMGKYTKWLLSPKNMKIFEKIKEEDYYKITEDLQKYDKLKLSKRIPQEYADINKFDINTFTKYMFANFKDEDIEGISSSQRGDKIKSDVEKYDIGSWLIIVPKTEEASCYYGKGTRWCTAANNNNMFDKYSKTGKLWILINKKDPADKYQFHFEDVQFMDAEDNQIDTYEFYLDNSDVYDFFVGKGYIKPNISINEREVISDFYDEYADDIVQKRNVLTVIDSYYQPYDEAMVSAPYDLDGYQNYVDTKMLRKFISMAIDAGYISRTDANDITEFSELLPYIEGTDIAEVLLERFQDTYAQVGLSVFVDLKKYFENTVSDYIAENRGRLQLYYSNALDGQFIDKFYISGDIEVNYYPNVSEPDFISYYKDNYMNK